MNGNGSSVSLLQSEIVLALGNLFNKVSKNGPAIVEVKQILLTLNQSRNDNGPVSERSLRDGLLPLIQRGAIGTVVLVGAETSVSRRGGFEELLESLSQQ